MMDVTRTQELRRYQANSRRIQQWSLRGLVAGVAAGLVGAVVVGAEVGLPIAAL
jgi:hypothetical protein